MRKEIEARVERAIAEKVFPGCVVGIVRTDGVREVMPFGHFAYEQRSPEVHEGTVYDLASVTKSIPVASLALALIAEGTLQLADPVRTHLPELHNDRGATVEDLLAYRVHGPQLSMLKEKTPDEMLSYIFGQGFDAPPGESHYTNLPALLLGLIVERVGGAPLDVLAQKYFFGPLGMDRTTFFPVPDGCAPTEVDERGEVRGLPHDESAYVFARARRAAGHAGLFSTAPDILNFLEALLRDELGYIVAGAERGLGWQLNEMRFMGKYAGARTFGKTGFTGTSVVADRERGIAFVILSNRTYPKRPPNDEAIYEFRRGIADILLR